MREKYKMKTGKKFKKTTITCKTAFGVLTIAFLYLWLELDTNPSHKIKLKSIIKC